MRHYIPRGVCASAIDFDIVDGVLRDVRFTDGCPGNAQAVARLLEGMDVEDALPRLRGIVCRNGTSCADQLAQAIEEARGMP